MNRNVLKIIAIITMLIDHLGLFFFNNNILMRVIGRISYPIFAFFIAEGLRYTKNKSKYVLTLLIFALISQIPYGLLFNYYKLNVLFTFLLAILLIYLLENVFKKDVFTNVFRALILIFAIIVYAVVFVFLDVYGVVEYSIFGVLLVIVFYFPKSKLLRLIFASLVLILMTLKMALVAGFSFRNIIQIFSLVSILILTFYNNKKGKINLKYFFYIFYPLHMLIIWLFIL